MRLGDRKYRRLTLTLTPLIDVVFIVLVFFLAASKVRPFTDRHVEVAETVQAPKLGAVPYLLVLRADGRSFVQGVELNQQSLQGQFQQWARDGAKGATIVADKSLAATKLVKVVTMVNGAGIANVKVLTRNAE